MIYIDVLLVYILSASYRKSFLHVECKIDRYEIRDRRESVVERHCRKGWKLKLMARLMSTVGGIVGDGGDDPLLRVDCD